MTKINDEVYDGGLTYADTNGTRVDLCTADPLLDYGNATSTSTGFSIGNSAVNTGTPTDGAQDGRKVIVPAINGGDIGKTGTASHWALTNGSNAVIASGALTTPVSFTAGNKFSLSAIDIAIRDAGVTADIDLPAGTTYISYDGTNAFARLKIDNDGYVYYSQDNNSVNWKRADQAAVAWNYEDDFVDSWCRPISSAPGDFEVRWTAATGTLTSSTAAEDTWYALSGGDFELWNQKNTSGIKATTFDIEIRQNTTTLATGTFRLIATYAT